MSTPKCNRYQALLIRMYICMSVCRRTGVHWTIRWLHWFQAYMHVTMPESQYFCKAICLCLPNFVHSIVWDTLLFVNCPHRSPDRRREVYVTLTHDIFNKTLRMNASASCTVSLSVDKLRRFIKLRHVAHTATNVLWTVTKIRSILLAGRRGPYGCHTSRLSHFLGSWLTDGGDAVSFTR